MPEGIGYSFSPLQNRGVAGRAKPETGTQTQEAIRTISTRIPRIAQGGSALAPQPLLNAVGGAGFGPAPGTLGQPNLGGLEELIRRLFGIVNQPMRGGMPQPAPAGGAPAPRVIPGHTGPLPPTAPVPDAPTTELPTAPGQPNMGNFNPGQQGPYAGGGPYQGLPPELSLSDIANRAMWGG